MNWKKFLAVSISVFGLVSSEQVISACADYNNYDTYPQFFGNEAPGKPAYMPFNFVSGDLYYSDYRYWDENYSGTSAEKINKQLILEEWKTALDNKFSINTLKAIVYDAGLNSLFALKADGIAKGSNDSLAGNEFYQFLAQKKNKEYLDYLIYAKKCEINASQANTDWNDNKKKPIQSNNSLKDEGLTAFKKEKNDFLKMKYAFQVLRMAFYANQNDEVLSLYDQYLANKADRSVAYTRIIGFKAGAHYRNGDKPLAGYYYAKMFDNSDAYKYEAMISFEWSRKWYDSETSELKKDRIQEIYDLCKTDHERAVVLVMKGLRAYPDFALEDIKKAYALDPKVEGIDVLMNREINKLEEDYFQKLIYAENQLPDARIWYYSIRSMDYGDNKADATADKRYKDYIKSLNAFIDQLIADKKAGTPALWYLTKAYLACMQNNAPEMQAGMDKAVASGMKESEKGLYQVIDLLYTLYKSKTITTQIETDLLPKLKALNEVAKKSDLASYQFRDVMNHLVAGKYFQQGDTIKGVYAMAHANTWDSSRASFDADKDFQDIQGDVLSNLSVASLRKVQAFRADAKKSAFEEWLVAPTYYTLPVLKELEGTMYVRSGDFKSAIKIFEQKDVPASSFPNPFMPQINDYIEIYAQDTARTYTKLSFSKRMAELQDIIAKNPNDAGALYGYAVALYNISYYGKAADIVAYNRIATDDNGYFKDPNDAKLPRHLLEYYRVFSAEQYFNKAAAAAVDPELKAKALWGAAKCWTKRSPTSDGGKAYYYDEAYYTNALKNPYFEKLSTTFSGTRYMQLVKGTCAYYADYLSKK
ncbi:MAG: hypothetical protein JNM21_11460 [Taibaiella sp.]|nr:hypothetical protein [Taibaiella sp.]